MYMYCIFYSALNMYCMYMYMYMYVNLHVLKVSAPPTHLPSLSPSPSLPLPPPLPPPSPSPPPSGATNAELGGAGVTHLVVADTVEPADIPLTSSRVMVVKQQWFWESIQIEACADESLYQAKVGPPSISLSLYQFLPPVHVPPFIHSFIPACLSACLCLLHVCLSLSVCLLACLSTCTCMSARRSACLSV